MTPTPELRFVEREIRIHPADCLLPTVRVVKILQQKWEDRRIALAVHRVDERGYSLPPLYRSEWRDVPCVKEGGA